MDELARVADRLTELTDRLVEQQLTALREFDTYRNVPESDLRRSAERNVARIVSVLRAAQALPDWIVEDERRSGRRRALQGVPSDDVVAAYRTALGLLRDAFLETSNELNVSLDAVVLGMRRLWDVSDRYSSELVSARHQFDIDLTRRSERERLSFLHNLITGTLRGQEIVDGATSHGLPSSVEYWVVRARSTAPGAPVDPLLATLGRATDAPTAALLGLFGTDVAGVVARLPDSVAEAVVGVAGPVALPSVPGAFTTATNLLEVAARFGMTGIVDAAGLSLRAAVAQQVQLGEMLVHRFIDPVRASTNIADEILFSVKTYLDQRRSIPAAAKSLTVHANTLRYRIERFEVITGADLQNTLTSFEVWWALEYTRISNT